MSDSSASAIVNQAKSGKRYECRDKALAAFARYPMCTGNEIALHVLESDNAKMASMLDVARIGIRMGSIQKRVSDLAKLDYITEVDKRVCHVTGYIAVVYVVSDKGSAYLRKHGYHCATPVHRIANVDVPKIRDKRSGLAALKASREALR